MRNILWNHGQEASFTIPFSIENLLEDTFTMQLVYVVLYDSSLNMIVHT